MPGRRRSRRLPRALALQMAGPPQMTSRSGMSGAMLLMTKMLSPTGGRMSPISMTIVIRMPNQTRLNPATFSGGRNKGNGHGTRTGTLLDLGTEAPAQPIPKIALVAGRARELMRDLERDRGLRQRSRRGQRKRQTCRGARHSSLRRAMFIGSSAKWTDFAQARRIGACMLRLACSGAAAQRTRLLTPATLLWVAARARRGRGWSDGGGFRYRRGRPADWRDSWRWRLGIASVG